MTSDQRSLVACREICCALQKWTLSLQLLRDCLLWTLLNSIEVLCWEGAEYSFFSPQKAPYGQITSYMQGWLRVLQSYIQKYGYCIFQLQVYNWREITLISNVFTWRQKSHNRKPKANGVNSQEEPWVILYKINNRQTVYRGGWISAGLRAKLSSVQLTHFSKPVSFKTEASWEW